MVAATVPLMLKEKLVQEVGMTEMSRTAIVLGLRCPRTFLFWELTASEISACVT